MNITILGAGDFGKVLGDIAEYNGHKVKFYDPYKFPKITLEEALQDSEVNIFAAPSSAANDILPKLPTDIPLICTSKGFVSKKPFEKFKDFSAFAGAGMADQIKAKNPPYGDKFIFTASSEISEYIFTTENIQIEYTDDTLGILICGALKNIYAIACGIYNFDRNLLQQIHTEWRETLKLNGASDLTEFSCGMPDLLMSVAYNSRNTEYGRTLAEVPQKTTVEPVGTVEGVNIVNSLTSYPEFEIPATSKILKTTIKRIKDATKL